MPVIQGKNGTIDYEFRERLGVIPSGSDAWDKQLNLICWNHKEPAKFDIRGWSPEGDRMTKGITLYENEMRELVRLFLTWSDMKNRGVDAKADALASREKAVREAEVRVAAKERAIEERAAEIAARGAAGIDSGSTSEVQDWSNSESQGGSILETQHESSSENLDGSAREAFPENGYETEDGASMVAEDGEHLAATEEETPF